MQTLKCIHNQRQSWCWHCQLDNLDIDHFIHAFPWMRFRMFEGIVRSIQKHFSKWMEWLIKLKLLRFNQYTVAMSDKMIFGWKSPQNCQVININWIQDDALMILSCTIGFSWHEVFDGASQFNLHMFTMFILNVSETSSWYHDRVTWNGFSRLFNASDIYTYLKKQTSWSTSMKHMFWIKIFACLLGYWMLYSARYYSHCDYSFRLNASVMCVS